MINVYVKRYNEVDRIKNVVAIIVSSSGESVIIKYMDGEQIYDYGVFCSPVTSIEMRNEPAKLDTIKE